MSILTSPFVRPIIVALDRSKWLSPIVNRLIINYLVNTCRNRPHPWSTAHDYVSWTSLTDRSYSARHLPRKFRQNKPPVDDLMELFRRRDDEQRYCEKSTCLFPAFAQYLTDGFLRSGDIVIEGGKPVHKRSNDDLMRNTSTHNIDLCTLYGRTEAQTNALRRMSEEEDDRGKLKSQIINGEEYPPYLYKGGKVKKEFAGLDPVLGPVDDVSDAVRASLFAVGGDRVNAAPQVAMINTLFLREHNRLAGLIAKAHPGWDDRRVFETARNTVIVIFIKIVVEDYINHISSAPFHLRADPRAGWRARWNRQVWITIEFSLLYRWHSLVPQEIDWGDGAVQTRETFLDNRPLTGLGLVGAFTAMSRQRAGKLGAFNTPEALLKVERSSIDMDRHAGLGSYADYRRYVGLSEPTGFADVSDDPDVQRILAENYDDPRDIDFYVGLMAEDTSPGSPLPPLITKLVAVDAFSQAMTNPLLSEHVFNEETFSKTGWDSIHETSTLRQVLDRNSGGVPGSAFIGMTQQDWKAA